MLPTSPGCLDSVVRSLILLYVAWPNFRYNGLVGLDNSHLKYFEILIVVCMFVYL